MKEKKKSLAIDTRTAALETARGKKKSERELLRCTPSKCVSHLIISDSL